MITESDVGFIIPVNIDIVVVLPVKWRIKKNIQLRKTRTIQSLD